MVRLLVALAIVMALFVYLNYGGQDSSGTPASPEARYEQGRQQVEGLEQQLQDQAREQLEAIDANSR